jgi:putative transposase
MPITLDIKPQQLVSLPTGLYRFTKEKRNCVLLLERLGTGFELPMPEHKLVDMLGMGKAKIIDITEDQTAEEARQGPELDDGDPSKRRPGAADNADFGPGEAWQEGDDPAQAKLTPEGQRALAFQFYTQKWDETKNGSLGNVGLQIHINEWRPIAIQMGIELPKGQGGFRVQPARLRNAINNCGRVGERPLRAFRDRRGKTPRQYFDDIVENKMKDAVLYYWSDRPISYDDAYSKFKNAMEEFNLGRADPLHYPDRPEVLRRRINKAANFATWSSKYSPSEAHRKFKGIRDGLVAKWPLELVIMDHTVIDTHTVLDTQTYLPLGRPVLTVAIDVATRMILGYLITFEPASLYSVLTTLKRVNKNKRYVRKLYPDISRGWDGWGRPEEILVDNAWEFKAPSLQHALHNLGTSLTWAPIHTPQYKAIGERFFRTLNMKLFHKLPGAVPYNPYIMRQVGLDPGADAVITLDDLDALMHETIILYQNERHEGLKAIPARVWRDKIAIKRRPFIRDITALDHILGRVDTARLTTSGIKFKNMEFHNEAITSGLLHDLLKDEAKRGQSDKTYGPGRANVVIKWNPADASSISVWNRGGSPAHYVTLPNRDKFFDGISFWHWTQIQEFMKKRDLDFTSEKDRWEAHDKLRKNIEKLARSLPLGKTRDARRGLAFSQGTFDSKNINEDTDIDLDTIIQTEADPSTDGLNQPEGVGDELAMHLLDQENLPPKGKTPSKKSIKKGQNTKARKDAEKAAEAHEAQVRKQRGDPTGPVSEPDRKPDSYEEKLGAKEGWDEEEQPTPPVAEAPSVVPDEPEENNKGWED